jgi:hypothetical protein
VNYFPGAFFKPWSSWYLPSGVPRSIGVSHWYLAFSIFCCLFCCFYLPAGWVAICSFINCLEEIKILLIHSQHEGCWHLSHTPVPGLMIWVSVMVTFVPSSVNKELLFVYFILTVAIGVKDSVCTLWMQDLSNKNTGHAVKFEFQMNSRYFFLYKYVLNIAWVQYSSQWQYATVTTLDKILHHSSCLITLSKDGKRWVMDALFPYFKVLKPGIDLTFYLAPPNSTTACINYSWIYSINGSNIFKST